MLTGRTITPEMEAEMLEIQRKSLSCIDDILSKHRYICQTARISIADLSCYSEIIQLLLVDFDFREYPFIFRWMQEIKDIPGVKLSQEELNKIVPKL